MTTSAQAVAFFLFLLAAGGGSAPDTLHMRAGAWEITTITTMPMMPSPRTTTSTECVTDEAFDPRTLMEDAKDCRVTRQSVKGNTMTWSMECVGEEARMGGRGEFTVEDTTAHGSMQMELGGGGPMLEMKTSWTAKHVGPCK
jgi:hypothetical protein